MIILYGSTTSPNVLKVRVMLEEAGIPYQEKQVRRQEGENKTPEFLKISPGGTLPAIIDDETGACIFESSAILLYLADRSQLFLPAEPEKRADVYKWLVFEIANASPMIDSMYKLFYLDENWSDGAMQFLRQNLKSAMDVLENQLANDDYIAGECSIADFSLFPLTILLEDFLEQPLSDFPNLARWSQRMKQRTGVQKASGTFSEK
jgi:GST-like protein